MDTWITKVQEAIDNVNEAKRYTQLYALASLALLVYIAVRVSKR